MIHLSEYRTGQRPTKAGKLDQIDSQTGHKQIGQKIKYQIGLQFMKQIEAGENIGKWIILMTNWYFGEHVSNWSLSTAPAGKSKS